MQRMTEVIVERSETERKNIEISSRKVGLLNNMNYQCSKAYRLASLSGTLRHRCPSETNFKD